MTTTTTAAAAVDGATSSSSIHSPRHAGGGVVSRLVRLTGRTLRNSLIVVGVAAVAVAYNEYATLYPNHLGEHDDDDDEKQKLYNNNSSSSSGSAAHKTTTTTASKQVLVIPFHRIQIVAEKDPLSDLRRRLAQKLGGSSSDNDPEPILQYRVDELVELIHQAASDPSIGALYGIFGHGQGAMGGGAGWADLEEIRNALRVFRESHRRHVEPNLGHACQVIPRIQSKPLYAYTDTFASSGDSATGNPQYYLASIFTHIHMQKHGELNLFGLSATQFFVRGFLEKHGIVVHVLKHGPYKTAPNMFTEWGLNRSHLQQVSNILQRLQHDICLEITSSRSKALLASWLLDNKSNGTGNSSSSSHYNNDHLWKRIHNSGTFPALTAWKSGLVDYLPRRDPLADLVHANGGDGKHGGSSSGGGNNNRIHETTMQEAHKDKVKAQWDCQETDFDRFPANQIITLDAYQTKMEKQKMARQRHEQWAARKQQVQDMLANNMGFSFPGSNNRKKKSKKQRQEIALLHVNGTIGNDAARRLVDSIRKIRAGGDATKCVVVHVTSPGGTMDACETISQELQALTVPVIFSFGNVSASGGYYIAARANRIFCSKKTLTGSIGVFCLRPDLTPLAARYGINVEHVSLGNELAGTFQPFHPLTRKMRNNLALSISDKYAQFKNVVSHGRGLDLDEVEALAQGQVWTGLEAKMNGLVDEVGGLDRAIAYAKRNFTDYKGDDEGGSRQEEAQVVVWPKKTSFVQKLLDASKKGDVAQCWALLSQEWKFATSCGPVSNDMKHREWDEGGMAHWLGQAKFPAGSGLMVLAADEDTAIRILLEGASGKMGARSSTSMIPPPSEFWM